jgi:hypothetical protein
MMQGVVVKVYEKSDHEKVMQFLQNVSTLSQIEEELFNNAILIIENEEVVGMISYELFRQRALIRYFIFDKEVNESYLVEMYQLFFNVLKERAIDKVFVIVSNETIESMFTELGFKPFNKEEFFLTEENISHTKYKDSSVLFYQL